MQGRLLGSGLMLWGLLLHAAIVRAQEPAFIGGDQAVRFEQAPGFFHYAALCRTATEFKAQIPPNRLPREMTESAVCWYVMGSRPRAGGGAKDSPTSADGKLILSEHHVRFIPHDASQANLYMDLHPQEIEMKHEAGQPFASLATKEVLFSFRFSKLCPTCARGTPIPHGSNPALLEQEFKLVGDSLRNFHSGWSRTYALSSKIRIEVFAGNQPSGTDSPADMRFYGNLNLHLAEFCSEPAKSCIGSFATYETCKALSRASGCGQPPSCSASCAVSLSDLQNLQVRPCVQLDQQGASLLPDWSLLSRPNNPGNIPAKPVAGVVEIQFTTGSNPPPGVGCTVQASYLRNSNAGGSPAQSDRILASAKPGPAGSAKPVNTPTPKPSGAASANPTAISTKPAAPVAPKPSTVSPAANTVAVAPKPAVVPSAKSGGISSTNPNTASLAKSIPPTIPKRNSPSSTKPGAVAPSTSAGLVSVKPSDLNSGKSSATASTKPALVTETKPSEISSATPAAALPSRTQKESRNALRISRETAVGMLVKKVTPTYPLEAKIARVQGTVVLDATISTTGEVSSVEVVSGPPLLQSAATDAVKQWQYKPFSFNGQPVEVETTIHVVFGEGGSPAATPSHP